MHQLMSVFGIFFVLFLAWLLSAHKKDMPWRLILWGLALQFIFALLILGVPSLGIPGILRGLFDLTNHAFNALLNFTDAGSRFLFGQLIDPNKDHGFIFAVKVLPSIIFFSSLMAIAYHLGLMQKIVGWMARIMQNFLGTSGAETLSAAVNIFVGQTEAPLLVKPYVAKMTRSELMAIMVGGFANVAGGVLTAYVALLRDRMPDIAGHLMSASVMSAPSSLLLAKILLPEKEEPLTRGTLKLEAERPDANLIEAAARGASEGLTLALNVAAMLLAFIALVAMGNGLLNWLGGWSGIETLIGKPLSLEWIMGWVFAPIAFLIGVPWHEATQVGSLLGQKMVLNEFVAYLNLAQTGSQLSDRSFIMASYALCGFANFASIAIQIGGISVMAPKRRSDLARMGFVAMLGGTLSTLQVAAIAGILY